MNHSRPPGRKADTLLCTEGWKLEPSAVKAGNVGQRTNSDDIAVGVAREGEGERNAKRKGGNYVEIVSRATGRKLGTGEAKG